MDKQNNAERHLVCEPDIRALLKRITAIRTGILRQYPFYGSLLLRLKIGFARCGTAYTDLEKIVFDPFWIQKLDDGELKFLLLHELLHCVFNHIGRGKGKVHIIYNIAADIVVNSHILREFGMGCFVVDGEEVMHTSLDGQEGYMQSVEEVYHKLLSDRGEDGECRILGQVGKQIDRHDIWQSLDISQSVLADWKQQIDRTAKMAGNRSLWAERECKWKFTDKPGMDWRSVLQDFLKKCSDVWDYDFQPPDVRYALVTEYMLPGFHETDRDVLSDLWFVVDTSGSVSSDMIVRVYDEIHWVIEQTQMLNGKLSFFDAEVTEPVPFQSVGDLLKIQPVGQGGTSFEAVFRYMAEHMSGKETLPKAVIILTDGYAPLPPEEMAMGVPVLWVLMDTKIRKMKWGRSVYIEKKG